MCKTCLPLDPPSSYSLDPPSSYRPDVYTGTLCTAVRRFRQVPHVQVKINYVIL